MTAATSLPMATSATPTLVSRLLAEHQIDAVVNFAAESHVDRSIDSPEPFVQTNVVGTLRLLNAARLYWTKLPDQKKSAFRFLHVSTDEVYGTLGADRSCVHRGDAVRAELPVRRLEGGQRSSRPQSYQHTYKLPTLTTNCSNNYGPYHFPEKLIPLVILNALEGKPLPVYGDGMQIRDWLYVEDHAAAIWLVLQRGRVGETYNIGGLNEKPNIEIVKTICALLGRRSLRALTASRTRPKSPMSPTVRVTIVATPSIARRFRSELGWAPRENFSSGISKTVDWYLNHRAWAADITTGSTRANVSASGDSVADADCRLRIAPRPSSPNPPFAYPPCPLASLRTPQSDVRNRGRASSWPAVPAPAFSR